MQISTKLFIVCVLAATTAPFSSRGADTDSQIKAREALRQKMSELNAQPAVTNAAPSLATPAKAPETKPASEAKPAPESVVTTPTPAPVPADTVKTVPPPTPAPAQTVEPTPTPGSAPAPVVKSTRKPKPAPVAKTAPASGVTASRPDSERIAKARQALEEKMRELNAQGNQPAASQPVVTQQPASQPPANQPAVAAQPLENQPAVAAQPPANQPTVASQPAPASTSAPVHRTPEISSTSQPSVSAEINESTEPLPTPPPVKKSPQPEPKKAQKSNKPRELRPVPESRPLYALPQGPPPPVSAEKVQKLNALLQQYQADRITPEQYHQERAKILAGP
jgi:hypothetical protein